METRHSVVCFNGEIFNYRELRAALPGYAFHTRGDTEVLLALFEQYGADCVTRLRGQFAFAVFDKHKRELWLFRDRLGVLPLYYSWDGERFVFGSEIKALLPAIKSRPEVDEESLVEYLTYRSVPWPHTLFKNIRKVPPGHWIRMDTRGRLVTGQYWQIPHVQSIPQSTLRCTVEHVSEALEEAVKTRLVADVPVGAYLSGGLDSSLIVALMAKLQGEGNVATFSAGFGDPRHDEMPFARAVSERFKTRHHAVSVQEDDFTDLWPKLTWHRDAPLSEPADVAVFKLASAARNSVKVLLSGEGSDELFAGYPKYRFARIAGLADLLPPALRRPLFGRLERLLPATAARPRVMLRAMTAATEADRFQEWFAPFTKYERTALSNALSRDGHRDIHSHAEGDLIRRMLFFDCHTWLVDNLLERGDRMAMAASVESRPPFLDHHLVELAFSLPSRCKVRWGTGKWIVKEVARPYLPRAIIHRRKVGFHVPLDRWFRGGLQAYARDLLLAPNAFVTGVFDKTAVKALLESHAKGRRNEAIRIWTLLGLEVWHSVFMSDSGWVGE